MLRMITYLENKLELTAIMFRTGRKPTEKQTEGAAVLIMKHSWSSGNTVHTPI